MKVLVTDPRSIVDGSSYGTPSWEGPHPYREAVENAGGELVLGNFTSLEEIKEGVRDADVVVTFAAPLPRDIIEAMERTKLIIRSGVGFEIIDVKAATENGIPVSNIPDAAEHVVAESAVTLALAAAHNISHCDHAMRRDNGWGDRQPVNLLHEGTYGIVGLGHIGRAAIPKAKGLGMDVIAYDPYLPRDVYEHLEVEEVGFDELLQRSDVVDVHTPHTAETEQLFSTREFEMMKESAVIANTARGPIIDEEALVEAVESREIYGAGLDVFETEPPVDSPVLDCSMIVVSPHNAGIAAEGEDAFYVKGTEEILRVLNGEHPRYVVNPEVYKYPSEGPVSEAKGGYGFATRTPHGAEQD